MTPWTVAYQVPLSFIISQSLLNFMSIELVMLSNHLILYCPLLFFPFNLSQYQGLFQGVGSSHQVAKVWTFSSSPSNEYSGFISLELTGLILLQSKGLLRAMP